MLSQDPDVHSGVSVQGMFQLFEIKDIRMPWLDRCRKGLDKFPQERNIWRHGENCRRWMETVRLHEALERCVNSIEIRIGDIDNHVCQMLARMESFTNIGTVDIKIQLVGSDNLSSSQIPTLNLTGFFFASVHRSDLVKFVTNQRRIIPLQSFI